MKNGFTLIELMVTMAMAVIVLTVGVPALRELVAGNRLAAQTNRLVTALNAARSEAVKRGVRVSVCASDPAAAGNSAQTQCTGTWDKGWVVFTDADGGCDIDSGVDTQLRVFEGLEGGNTLAAVKKSDSAPVACAGYLAVGFSVITDDDVIFTLCDPGRGKARVLELAKTGRLNKTDATC